MSTQLVLPAAPADPSAAQALFKEARRRRMRRWLTGMTVVLLIIATVAVSTFSSTPRSAGRGTRGTGPAGAVPAARSSAAAVWYDGVFLHVGYIHPGGDVTQRVVAEVNAAPLPLLSVGGRVYWVDPAGTFVPALGHWSEVVRYLDVATGRMGTAGAGQTVFLSADGRYLLMSQTATSLTETPLTGGAARQLTLPRGWYLPGGDGLADVVSGAGLATANGIVVQAGQGWGPGGSVLAIWNPNSGRVTVIGRAVGVIGAYTPPGARYSLLAWLSASCGFPGSCALMITNTATLSSRTVHSPLSGGFALGGAFSPSGAPRARLAVFLNAGSGNAARLALVDPATGALRVVPRPSLVLGEDVAWARWLPDGVHLMAGPSANGSDLVDAATLSAEPLVVTHEKSWDLDYTTAVVPLPG
jgi:hypothetical protein